MKNFYSPNDFLTGTDSERIQAAIAAAKAEGCNRVVIPRANEALNSWKWIIDKTILLPSDITVILDDCHLVMADNVMCRMFQNSNATLPEGGTLKGEQNNIRMIGVGNTVLDGGRDNGLNERTSGKNGFPIVLENLTIFFRNVRDFEIRNLTIRDQRWWAIELLFSRRGTVADIRFEITDPCEYGSWRNQDGIDLRVGCNNILIQNISGEVGDDCIALTALMRTGSHEDNLRVEGKDSSIHDVIIRDVRAVTSMCATIRLLNQFGHKIYNISMDNIMDTSIPKLESKTQKVIRIGEYSYFKNDDKFKVNHGDMHDISISNVYSRALSAIHLEMTVKNLHVNNVYVHSDGQYAATFGRWVHRDVIFMYKPELWDKQKNKTTYPDGDMISLTAENVLIENVYYTANGENDNYKPTVIGVHNSELKNVTIRNVCLEGNAELLKCTDGKVPEGLVFE